MSVHDILKETFEKWDKEKTVGEVLSEIEKCKPDRKDAYSSAIREYFENLEHPDRDPLHPLMYGGYNYDA